MTRTDKILKLANAIRQYRGVYITETKKWKRPPVKSALKRVVRWMTELGLDPVKEMTAVDGFGTFDNMDKWIKGIK